MPRPSRRALSAIDALTTTPPPTLPPTHTLARILHSTGNNLHRVLLPSSSTTTIPNPSSSPTTCPNTTAEKQKQTEILVELPPLFRGKIWLKRGGYVLVDTGVFSGRENKIGGEIVNVVREEREWRRMGYWPKEFAKGGEMDGGDSEGEDSGEESTVGKMPPGSDDEE